MIELALAVAGILLAIIALPWLTRPINDSIRTLKDHWLALGHGDSELPAIESIRAGTRRNTREDFFICDWNHSVNVDDRGDTQTIIDCLLVNTSTEPQDSIAFPVYFENPKHPPTGWSKVGRAREVAPSAGSNVLLCRSLVRG